jgi:hypothetical protein
MSMSKPNAMKASDRMSVKSVEVMAVSVFKVEPRLTLGFSLGFLRRVSDNLHLVPEVSLFAGGRIVKNDWTWRQFHPLRGVGVVVGGHDSKQVMDTVGNPLKGAPHELQRSVRTLQPQYWQSGTGIAQCVSHRGGA